MDCSPGRTTGGSNAAAGFTGPVISIFGCEIMRDMRGSCGGGGEGWAKPVKRLQAPNIKLQRNTKLQAPKQATRHRSVGVGGLELLWGLELGIWSFTTTLAARGPWAWPYHLVPSAAGVRCRA